MNSYRIFIDNTRESLIFIYQIKDEKARGVYTNGTFSSIDREWFSKRTICSVEEWQDTTKRRAFDVRAKNVEEVLRDNLIEFL